MNTQQLSTRTERVDDIPLLLAQMNKVHLSDLIDESFPMHGNWQGLSMGQVTSGVELHPFGRRPPSESRRGLGGKNAGYIE